MVFTRLESLQLPVTATYAGATGLLLVFLGLRTFLSRLSTGVLYGTGSQDKLLQLSRAHGNLQEVFAIFFGMFALLEANNILTMQQLQIVGTIFLVIRLGHAFQLSNPSSPIVLRAVGFLGTSFLLAAMSAILLYHGAHSSGGLFQKA
ncbi:hypothetical protein WJX72_004496 [[Myrmecia] bisecta]|uniref:Glutathione S-transferase n=1 Tax=[Myrmecia] bisecta TaxID=41462 RepID=A0AAW1QBC5_9CHLO